MAGRETSIKEGGEGIGLEGTLLFNLGTWRAFPATRGRCKVQSEVRDSNRQACCFTSDLLVLQ